MAATKTAKTEAKEARAAPKKTTSTAATKTAKAQARAAPATTKAGTASKTSTGAGKKPGRKST